MLPCLIFFSFLSLYSISPSSVSPLIPNLHFSLLQNTLVLEELTRDFKVWEHSTCKPGLVTLHKKRANTLFPPRNIYVLSPLFHLLGQEFSQWTCQIHTLWVSFLMINVNAALKIFLLFKTQFCIVQASLKLIMWFWRWTVDSWSYLPSAGDPINMQILNK